MGGFRQVGCRLRGKILHLHSEQLGTDYRDYQTLEVPIPQVVMRPDTTEPDVCMIEVTDQDPETGMITVSLAAADYDSGMLYYDYSYDGGETFSPRFAWTDKAADTITFTMQAPPHIVPQIVARGYNGYDLFSISNLVTLPSMDYKTEEEIAAELAEKEALAAAAQAENNTQEPDVEQKNYKEIHRTRKKKADEAPTVGDFLKICLVCALLVFGAALSVSLILQNSRLRKKSGGRRKRKKRRGRHR